MAGQEESGTAKITDIERANLEAEYRELCGDWRSRDKYVLDKLGVAGILFGLLGVALGTLEPTAWIAKLCLLFIGAFFALILSISVAKDTYYRDGTEQLLRRLSVRLGIDYSLQRLGSLEDFLPDYEGRPFSQFTRKIKIKEEKSSLKIPGWSRHWLVKQDTFRWILAFYLTALLAFVALFILILVNQICGLDLPI